MGRIKELINIFLKPNEVEGEFNELAIASGLSPEEIKELNKAMNGIEWAKFAGEYEKKKSKKQNRDIKQIEPNIKEIGTRQSSNKTEQER